MEYFFYREGSGRMKVRIITRNWIGQKTENKRTIIKFEAKGLILRKIVFAPLSEQYGKIWFYDCKKVKKILEEEKESYVKWSDTWF